MVSQSWTGYYEQFGTQHPVTFEQFQIKDGFNPRVIGSGEDEVGKFMINGTSDVFHEKVQFIKSYESHEIFYSGVVNKKQKGIMIEGHWGFQEG